jgi:hypothetical protein
MHQKISTAVRSIARFGLRAQGARRRYSVLTEIAIGVDFDGRKFASAT